MFSYTVNLFIFAAINFYVFPLECQFAAINFYVFPLECQFVSINFYVFSSGMSVRSY